MPVNKKAIKHFERLGKVIAESHVPEAPPKYHLEVRDRMMAIDPRCGSGTEDPLSGDLASHLAYLEFREAWVKKRGHRGAIK
ncbi:MAG: hypothetical protein OXG15_06395 [Gammaproteobacteria bacterium]|nr:hypothetical protein [Gammaproteobacteria bacterium]